jgi:hypothetical protein
MDTETIIDEIKEDNTLKPEDNANFGDDPNTLKVRGGDFDPNNPGKKPTDAVALSRAMLHVLAKNDHVKVLSVGPKALSIVMKAYRLAARETETHTNGAVLVIRQSEYEATVGGKKTKGLCTRIFGIPIRYAR